RLPSRPKPSGRRVSRQASWDRSITRRFHSMATVTEQTTLGLKDEAPKTTNIIVTEKAADEVRRIIADQEAAGTSEKLYLRMRVVGGGCSGFQHKLDLDPQ